MREMLGGGVSKFLIGTWKFAPQFGILVLIKARSKFGLQILYLTLVLNEKNDRSAVILVLYPATLL